MEFCYHIYVQIFEVCKFWGCYKVSLITSSDVWSRSLCLMYQNCFIVYPSVNNKKYFYYVLLVYHNPLLGSYRVNWKV